MGRFFSDKVRKRVISFGLFESFFCISRGKKRKYILLVRDKFNFLHVDIWFDVTECKFIMKNSSFKMLVVFSPIFVADTKITFVYNFVAPSREVSPCYITSFMSHKILNFCAVLEVNVSNTAKLHVPVRLLR